MAAEKAEALAAAEALRPKLIEAGIKAAEKAVKRAKREHNSTVGCPPSVHELALAKDISRYPLRCHCYRVQTKLCIRVYYPRVNHVAPGWERPDNHRVKCVKLTNGIDAAVKEAVSQLNHPDPQKRIEQLTGWHQLGLYVPRTTGETPHTINVKFKDGL